MSYDIELVNVPEQPAAVVRDPGPHHRRRLLRDVHQLDVVAHAALSPQWAVPVQSPGS